MKNINTLAIEKLEEQLMTRAIDEALLSEEAKQIADNQVRALKESLKSYLLKTYNK